MICVCLWAGWIYAVEKGSVDVSKLPAYLQTEPDNQTMTETNDAEKPNMRHNLGLAHTHINGQTLLFFAIGLIFLFTSAKEKIKKIVLWLFAVSIVVHTIGLSGMHYASIYDDILAISGVAILVLIVYMAFVIVIDLAKKPTVSN